MNLVDRYLLTLFFRIFLICFVSFSGLFIVIHFSTNLDELVEAGEVQGGLGQVFVEFYGPRVLDIFDRSAGFLVLLSAIFALGLVERRREMIAIQSAGIPKLRLVRPILIGSVCVLLLAVLNRELLIPKFKESLVRTPQTWLDSEAMPMTFQKDIESGCVIRGSELFVAEDRISDIEVQLPVDIDCELQILRAETGTIEKANANRPGGLLLRNTTTEGVANLKSVRWNDRTLVFFPGDTPWLSENQVFITVQLDAKEMAFGKKLNRYATLPDRIASIQQPRLQFGRGPQIEVHSRIMQPVFDLMVLLLGLPLAIGRGQQSIFASAGLCLAVVVVVQITTVACQSLGAISLLQPAALAVWLPIIIFLPLGVVSMRRLLK